MNSFSKIRSFSEIGWDDFQNNILKAIDKEINNCNDDYILNICEEKYITYLVEKFTFEPLDILSETEEVGTPVEIRQDLSEYQNRGAFSRFGYYRNGYKIEISYSFKGSCILFKVRPNPFTLTAYDIYVDESNEKVSFFIQIFSQNVEEFNREKSSAYSNAFTNIQNINHCVNSYNSNLYNIIKKKFEDIKQKRLNKTNFFRAIKVKNTSNTPSTYGVPIVHRKSIEKPSIGKRKEYSIEPTLDMDTYESIITEINQLGRSMERKPSLYIGKDEEGIRDVFVTMLETKFDGVTATGETFNYSGKTDILLKNVDDNSNLFIAECKFWHGQEHFKKAISQLFDRYLTWRDSKVALMVFVKGGNFTSVLDKIRESVMQHVYYVRENMKRDETSVNYIFRLPKDPEKEVFLEIMAFNFDKMNP